MHISTYKFHINTNIKQLITPENKDGRMTKSDCPYRPIESSVDRVLEAKFHIQQLEHAYHQADPFRWSLNCFLRSLKEIPQIIRMELQSRTGFKSWFDSRYERVKGDPLINYFGKQRDTIVHKEMLKPASYATIGITEGRGIKLGLGGYNIDPLEDSDFAIIDYLKATAGKKDFLGILADDEESMPCVKREWKLDGFPDELSDLAAKAWYQMADLISDTIQWLTEDKDKVPILLERGDPNKVRIKMYDRESLKRISAEMVANETKIL